ncbi:RNA polymerase sigma factor [Quillaja saponaria]|uniref:RNA polymerase sigma factor n=1 Tax=Quillaja saponaria TaxID=32244 RepID=A0AAD7QKD8_QUISA|nr:RNA polymerase sigma factor [Quillaja saponaria]
MALTSLCSSPNHTPTLPTISLSSIPNFPSVKTHNPLQANLHTPSSPSFGVNLLSNDALVIAAATEAVDLASASVQAARDAVLGATGVEEIWSCRDIDNGLDENGTNGLGVRRKRRRIRRKRLRFMEVEEDRNGSEQRVLNWTVKSRYFSPREEAELCLCLKEGAKLEEAKLRITEGQEHMPSLKQLAHDVKMKKRNMDKLLCSQRESRERITHSYRGLVASIAIGYQGKGLSLQDLIQEGSIGLLRGAEKFDPQRGHKLSTYVYWWIKQAIIKAIARKSRLVRLPESKSAMVMKILEANNILSKRLRRVPTYNETAKLLNVHVSTVRLVSESSRPPISLEREVTDRGRMTLQEVVPGPDELIPGKMVEKQLMKQEVEKLLKTLTKREGEILTLHFGLNGETPQSCEEIGRMLKLSRERVRQINGIALSKLRQTSIVDSLRFYLV